MRVHPLKQCSSVACAFFAQLSPDRSYRAYRDTSRSFDSWERDTAISNKRVAHTPPRGKALICEKVSQGCLTPPSQKSGNSPLGFPLLGKPEKTPVSSEVSWVKGLLYLQRYGSKREPGTELCVLNRWGAGIGRIQRSEMFTSFLETWHDVSEREREMVPLLDLLSSRVDAIRGAKTRFVAQALFSMSPRKLNKKKSQKEQQQL